MKIKAGVFGATGYTGLELLRLLINHPAFELAFLGSASEAGKKLGEIFGFLAPLEAGKLELRPYDRIPDDLELAFLALPHEVSMRLAPELLKRGVKVVDLSGAYRLDDPELFKEFYGFEHEHPSLLKEAVYGLSEIFKEEIKRAELVANPGCYPTAAALSIYPLAAEGLIEGDTVFVNGLSGVSGAGRSLKRDFHFPEMVNNTFAYKVVGHRHTPEMERVLRLAGGSAKVRFVPAVVPIDRGMVVTVQARVKRDPKDLFERFYQKSRFVKIVGAPPAAKAAARTNYCFIYPTYDPRTQTAVVVAAIDNLLKGAAGQAVQNANLMFSLPEETGLEGLLPSPV